MSWNLSLNLRNAASNTSSSATSSTLVSGQSNIYRYKISSSGNKDSLILAGEIRYDTSQTTSNKKLYISTKQTDSIDIEKFLSSINEENIIYIQDPSNVANFQRWKVTMP